MLEPTKEELSERYEQMADEEFDALQPANLTEVALEAYKAVLEKRNKAEYLELLQIEEKDRQDNEKTNTADAGSSTSQFSSEPEESHSGSSFMSEGYIWFLFIVILIVLRVSTAWPFGPDGLICKYTTPYSNTTAEYKFWNTLGGCITVVKR